MTKHRRECVRICEDEGLDVVGIENRSRHLALHTSKGVLFCPNTPSDRRWRMNMRAHVRRLVRS